MMLEAAPETLSKKISQSARDLITADDALFSLDDCCGALMIFCGGLARHLLVNLEKLGFHEKLDFLVPMAIEGVLTRQKCAGKWCATLWAPGLQFSVSPNRRIFNFHGFW